MKVVTLKEKFPVPINDISEARERLLAILDFGWQQGAYGDKFDRSTKCCIIGACNVAATCDPYAAPVVLSCLLERRLDKTCYELYGTTAISFNDTADRTVEEVKKLVREAFQ